MTNIKNRHTDFYNGERSDTVPDAMLSAPNVVKIYCMWTFLKYEENPQRKNSTRGTRRTAGGGGAAAAAAFMEQENHERLL